MPAGRARLSLPQARTRHHLSPRGGVGRGCGVGKGLGGTILTPNVQMNSSTGPPPQLKAPGGICIVFMPDTAGEVLKIKSIRVLLFTKVNESAGIPFTVKSLASTVAGSTRSLTSTKK